jgi:hypothetical protein
MTGAVFFSNLVCLILRLGVLMTVQKGFNSDISYKGLTYHVQTEDWGAMNPYIVSRVYRDGAVIKSVKIPYTKVLPTEKQKDSRSIRVALETQHQSILDLLLSGQLL